MVLVQNKALSEEILSQDSYDKLKTELQSIPEERVLVVNLDVPSAVSLALAVIGGLQRFREEIVKRLPDFDLNRFAQLEDRAMALNHVNMAYLTATKAPDDLKDCYEEGLSLRNTLHTDALTLAGRGYISAAAFKDYTGDVGFKNVATELHMVASVLRDNWQSIVGKCATDSAEIEHALKLSTRLLRGASQRQLNPAEAAQKTDERNRAFTLFIEAYDDARRAIQYLRWHEEDADTIAPNLYTGNTQSIAKKKNDKKDESVPAPAASGVQNGPSLPTAAPLTTSHTDPFTTPKNGTNGSSKDPFMT